MHVSCKNYRIIIYLRENLIGQLWYSYFNHITKFPQIENKMYKIQIFLPFFKKKKLINWNKLTVSLFKLILKWSQHKFQNIIQ